MAKGAGRIAIHLVAFVLGVILMIAGLAMGVTIVLLPFGLPVGIGGLFVAMWGLFGWANEGTATPAGPK
jgi:hypothetical protein